MNRPLVASLACLSLLLLVPVASAAEPTARESLEVITQELSRVDRLLSENNWESVGRAHERLAITQEKLRALAERVGRLEADSARLAALEEAQRAQAKAAETSAADASAAAATTAAATPKALDAVSFEKVRSQLAAAPNDGVRTGALKGHLGTSYFDTTQTLALLNLYTRSIERLGALQLLSPRIVDRQNAPVLQDAFKYAADKEKVLVIVNP